MPKGVISFLAIGLASIGVLGQAALLRHQLVDCYPFKLLNYPPAEFMSALGNYGFLLVVLFVLVGGLFLLKRSLVWAPALLCLIAPLAFALLFLSSCRLFYPGPVPGDLQNYDWLTYPQIRAEFLNPALRLSFFGVLIGGICSVFLRFSTR